MTSSVEPYSKARLSRMYRIKPSTFSKLLNEKYFHHLQPLGYKKTDKVLSPLMFAEFVRIYGEPFDE